MAEPEPGPGAERTTRRPADTARVRAAHIHPPTRLERIAYAMLQALVVAVTKLWFRLEIVGREKVPAHGPFVLAPVHRSNIDFMLVGAVTRRRMRYMGKASIWKWRPTNWFISMMGAFPVHRGTADRDALRASLEVIAHGEPLVMFPEGTRQSGPKLAPTFDGPAYVASRTGVPLVPVGIGGSEEAMPRGAKFVSPRKVVMVVGDPIVPPATDGGSRVPRRVVRELTEQLDEAIQGVYDEARRRAGVA
ncbi:MAG TPA: lysophospholipid acyltransferase family protein [Acidimicrobiales bacterium]